MATIVLAGAGAALGSGFGGAVLGVSGGVIGRAVGATLGRAIDQRLLGSGARAVETGRVDRFRLTGAGEGVAIPRVWGRMRLGGHVIWASRFVEDATRSGGGKGARRPATVSYSYSVSLAVALCEGEIAGIGRIWADGVEIGREDLALRVYTGGVDQMPDPRMEAVEGAGQVPAYRGIAYVVIEDLELGRFGNRVPQFSFEVIRAADAPGLPVIARDLQGVALIPGSGEYALATTPVHLPKGPGEAVSANVNSPAGEADLSVSLAALRTELPAVRSVVLVVSWFGDDLRCGHCRVEPMVADAAPDGVPMAWSVAGLTRASAGRVPLLDGRPVYGGTPADASVIEAIRALGEGGQEVVFYPFVLMRQMAGNDLPDPWTGQAGQPPLPWRGRITASLAPGRDGSPDRTAAVADEVAAFFGTAQAGDFALAGEGVVYSGPEEWSYRRFILHYAWLAKAAGGVAAFCVGSEMRALTALRGASDSFPAVAALRALAADVRAILGPEVRIGYAADWTEYAGFTAPEGNRYFHLDAFWADEHVDFVGIDNYMPLADWREGDRHADAAAGSVHDLGYLRGNIAGGEGFDWFYPDPRAEAAQRREPIVDGAHGEDWVWRLKDLRGWWENAHHDRIDGVRAAQATPWVPRSKPIWFTELGCPAVDKGANQPNLFFDAKSSESALPRHSTGRRDDLMQAQFLRAHLAHWADPAANPVSPLYGGPMVDPARIHVWAWDSRPFPAFPANRGLWSDGANWARGHWISGRAAAQPLDAVVAEICAAAGVTDIDVSGLRGLVRGYAVTGVESARASLQPLMLVHGFDAVERDGVVRFAMRDGRAGVVLDPDGMVVREGGDIAQVRSPQAETAGRVRVLHIEAEGDFEPRVAEAVFADDPAAGVANTEVPMLLIPAEARAIAARWLAEARVARDTVRFSLPPAAAVGAGDVVRLDAGGGARDWRIDRLERAEALEIEAVRVERGLYRPAAGADEEEGARLTPFVAPVPVLALFLDLPLMTGEEVAHAPHLAVQAVPWPGAVAVHKAVTGDAGYALNRLVEAPSAIGQLLDPLERAAPGRWDRGAAVRVRTAGAFAGASEAAVLAGANLVAVGDGSPGGWELMQFADAALVAPREWALSRRLRGQFGTDAVMPEVWPAGSWVVPVTPALVQLGLSEAARGLARHWRIGPAARPLDDPAILHRVEAFAGIGLRPYAPVHLRAVWDGDDLALSWVRRTRIGGDSWAGLEVPLGEEAERYLVRVLDGAGAVQRSAEVGAPGWVYGAAAQAADGAAFPLRLAVAQLSARFGAGPFAEIEVHG